MTEDMTDEHIYPYAAGYTVLLLHDPALIAS
jgi:hypothetical protein